jgi:acetyl esterase/lipase
VDKPIVPVPFDAELVPILEFMRSVMPTTHIDRDAIFKLREFQAPLRPSLEALTRDGAYTVEEVFAPGTAENGATEVELLVCRPAGEIRACLYFVHGGGMVMGDNRSNADGVLDLLKGEGIMLVSVEHRLAPEFPHPLPVEDSYAGLAWTAAHAAELGYPEGRLIVSGTSSGGGIAAALTLMARDRGGPALLGQLLMYPMLDDRNDSFSSHQMEGLGIWDRTANDTGWTALLGSSRGTADVSPYAAPARATDLSGLPPALIEVASAETFRDEDIAYASRIWAAGGVAELHVWPGGFHSFDGFAPTAQISQEAKSARLRWLRRLLPS